jgi:hypothetical protein
MLDVVLGQSLASFILPELYPGSQPENRPNLA